MLECWRGNAAERPSFSQLKAKFDAMLLSQEDNPYIQFNINMTMPYYSPTSAPLEGGACQEATNTSAPDQTTTVPLSLPPSNLTQEEDSLGPEGSNAYVQTPRACDDPVTFDLRVASTSELRSSKELALIEEETSDECSTESDMSVSEDCVVVLDVSTEGTETDLVA